MPAVWYPSGRARFWYRSGARREAHTGDEGSNPSWSTRASSRREDTGGAPREVQPGPGLVTPAGAALRKSRPAARMRSHLYERGMQALRSPGAAPTSPGLHRPGAQRGAGHQVGVRVSQRPWSAGRSIAAACNPRMARISVSCTPHVERSMGMPGSLGLQAVEEVRGTPSPHAQRSAGGRLRPIEPQRHRRGAISSVTGVRPCPGESSGERERTAGGHPPRQMMDALIGYRTPAIGRHSSTVTKGQAMTVR